MPGTLSCVASSKFSQLTHLAITIFIQDRRSPDIVETHHHVQPQAIFHMTMRDVSEFRSMMALAARSSKYLGIIPMSPCNNIAARRGPGLMWSNLKQRTRIMYKSDTRKLHPSRRPKLPAQDLRDVSARSKSQVGHEMGVRVDAVYIVHRQVIQQRIIVKWRPMTALGI